MELETNIPQLMLDDRNIESSKGMERRMGKPVKDPANPIFIPQEPWEGICVIMWGSVIWDPAACRFQMWYEAANPLASQRSDQTLLCYATSPDGLNWERPHLGLFEYSGSRENNIVYRPDEGLDTPTVILDPFDPPEAERYKMVLYDTKRRSFVRFVSPDGCQWTEIGPIELTAEVGDRHSVMVDEEKGRWIIYHKCRGQMRTIFASTSEDFKAKTWQEKGELLVSDDKDPPETEFYGMVGFRDQGQGMGYLEMFHVLDRHLDAELVTIDDRGIPQRYRQGEVFLERGPWGEWDAAWAFPSNNPPIRYGEELLIFYQGRRTIHWANPTFGGVGHIGAIGLARLRPQGFAYLESGNAGGTATTQPFELRGHFLCVNADASQGVLRAELLDGSGKLLPGYSAADCYPLENDATYFKLCWGRKSRLDEMIGQTVKLRFQAENAKLYAFWTSDRLF